MTYVVRPGAEAEAEAHLRALETHSNREPGCAGYVVHRSLEEPRRYFIYERYDDEAALDAHRSAPHFLEHGKKGLQQLAERREPHLYEPLG